MRRFLLIILFLATSYANALSTPPEKPVEEIKLALIGDTGATAGFESVLKLIDRENVDIIMVNGDLGYGLRPRDWKKKVLKVININKVAVIGSLGNHDRERNNAQRYIEVFDDFRTRRNRLNKKCTGDTQLTQNQDVVAVDETCTFGNLSIVASAIGQFFNKPYFEARLDAKLRKAPEKNWKLAGYHYTLYNMNPGIKSTQATYEFFDIIRQHGAIGAQAHTHSVMATCPIISEIRSGSEPVCHPDFTDLEQRFIAPGIGLYVDSSIGGRDTRRRGRCHNVKAKNCAHMVDIISDEGYTRVDGVKKSLTSKNGAMFITFNVGGDPNKAHAYFKSTDDRLMFQFSLDR